MNKIDDADLSKVVDGMVKKYHQMIYRVDYINEILAMMDKPIYQFSVSKIINLSTMDTSYSTYLFVFNEVIGVRPSSYDMYNIEMIYLHSSDKISIDEMLPEAQQKIKAKYLSLISRLEDTLELPLSEIITMELQ